KKCAYRAWRLVAAYMGLAAMIYLVCPAVLLRLFQPENQSEIGFSEILRNGSILLALAAFYNFFDATKFIFMGALRGAGDTKVLMFIAVSFSWGVMVTGVLAVIFLFHGTVVAVWIYLSVYVVLESMMMFRRFRSDRWQQIEMINRPPCDLEVPVSTSDLAI
ncbi:MAG: MATE family efflux transporter, partial [Victivallaceae bacterium]|nr:MATE family efflux transporter [Victivallaceae bacterium]